MDPRTPLHNRFSSASIRTLLPQYAAVDILVETALAVNGDSHGPPPYGPPLPNIRTSASAILANPHPTRWNRFSAFSSAFRILPPQYTAVDILEEPASTTLAVNAHGPPYYAPSSSPNIRTSVDVDVTEPSREVTLTWRANSPGTLLDTSEFQYSYPNRPKRPWATLHLQTRDAVPGNFKPLQSLPRVPRFWSCDPITGSLELNLDSPENIQQINISLNGSIVMSSASEMEFLGHEFTLWDKSMGDPLHSDDADANGTPTKKVNGRFASGKYTFPFSFHFPTHPDTVTKSAVLPVASSISPFPVGIPQSIIPVTTFSVPEHNQKKPRTSRSTSSSVSPAGKTETGPSASQIRAPSQSQTSAVGRQDHPNLASPLPQSFMEKGIKPSVSYEISIRITHGRFKASSRIRTDIVYIPALQPPPAPQKRREAYEAGALLPYPTNDPEVWFACPTLTLYGVVKPGTRPRHTRADCTLFLAQPLSYTRGSVIPCFLTISSDDDEVVRLLSSPETPTLRLVRRIRHPIEGDQAAASEDPGYLTSNTWKSWRPHTSIPTGEMQLVKHEVGLAQWWMPLKDVAQSPNVRHLEGEIHLSQNLQPSCDFRLFQVEYAVELLAFQTADFVHEIHPSGLGKLRKVDDVLASNPVEVATLYRQNEPIPTSYSESRKINMRLC